MEGWCVPHEEEKNKYTNDDIPVKEIKMEILFLTMD